MMKSIPDTNLCTVGWRIVFLSCECASPFFFHFVPEMPTFEISRNDTKTQFQLKVTGATPPIPPTRLFDAYRVSLPLPYHFCLVKLTEMRISFVTTAVCRPEVISCIMAVFCRTAHIKKKTFPVQCWRRNAVRIITLQFNVGPYCTLTKCKLNDCVGFCCLNLLKAKRNLLYIRNQSVPRSKLHHGYKSQSVTYREIIAVCSDIRTKHWTQSERHVEFFNVQPGGT